MRFFLSCRARDTHHIREDGFRRPPFSGGKCVQSINVTTTSGETDPTRRGDDDAAITATPAIKGHYLLSETKADYEPS